MSRAKTIRSSAKSGRTTTAPATDSREVNRDAIVACGIWCLIFFVYLPSLSSGFIWDDDDYVTQNATLRSWQGLKQIWLDPEATPQYYPLVYTTFWIEYHLWGLQPAGYHLVNAALHAANGVLVWLTLRRLSVPGAWLAALAFGLHPVHVESVSWVTERKNVLSGLFYLLALRTLIDILAAPLGEMPRDNAGRYWRRYALGFAFFVAALLCKSVTCSLPAVLLLVMWWKTGRPRLRETLPLIPLFLVGAVFAWHTNWLERNHVGAAGSTFAWTAAERLLIAGRAIWTYALQLVWPVNLSFMYARWDVRADSWWQWILALSAFAIPVAIAAWSRRMTGPLVALLYFGGTLLPALGFFNVFPMRYSFVADHFQYLASLGILALIAAWWMHPSVPAAGPTNRMASWLPTIAMEFRVAIAAFALVVLAIITWQRQSAFRDSFALWSDTLQKNPTSMAANIQLGRLASRKGEFAVAERYFRDGLRYRTDDLETHEFETNLAHALSGQGRRDEAAAEFHKALERKPDYPEALNGLANVEAQQGHFVTAIEHYRRGLTLRPGNSIIHANLGNALAASGQLTEAEQEYRSSLELDPSAPAPRLDLAKVMARQGRFRAAEAECLKVLQEDPRLASANRLLARIRMDQRRQTDGQSDKSQRSP
jgi:tetratricopeptide (TPR) repeat protein